MHVGRLALALNVGNTQKEVPAVHAAPRPRPPRLVSTATNNDTGGVDPVNKSKAERHARAAAGKARFYTGPAESGRGAAAAAAAAAAADDGDDAAKDRYGSSADAATNVWKPTPEELEEERFLRESLPAAYGDSSAFADLPAGDDDDDDVAGGTVGGGAAASAAAVVSRRPRIPSTPAAEAAAAGVAGSGAAQRRPAAAEGRRRRAQEGTQSGVRRRWAGQGRRAEGAGGDEGGGGSDDVVSTAVLEGENRDLVARMKNELDDARLVETKMSEVMLCVFDVWKKSERCKKPFRKPLLFRQVPSYFHPPLSD